VPFFGLRHLVMSTVGSNLRKLNTGAQLQTVPYPTASKSILYSNIFMVKSGAQTLTFKSVTSQTWRHKSDRISVTNRQKTQRFSPPRWRMKSDRHQTWHGDRGPRVRSFTSKTFGGLTHSFATLSNCGAFEESTVWRVIKWSDVATVIILSHLNEPLAISYMWNRLNNCKFAAKVMQILITVWICRYWWSKRKAKVKNQLHKKTSVGYQQTHPFGYKITQYCTRMPDIRTFSKATQRLAAYKRSSFRGTNSFLRLYGRPSRSALAPCNRILPNRIH